MSSPEGILQGALTGIGVALSNQRYGDSQASTFKHYVLRRKACVPPIDPKRECHVLAVTQDLIPKELA